MKHLVETTGDFMFLGLNPYQEVEAHRPCVVVAAGMTAAAIEDGRLRIVCEDIPEAMTDSEFAEAYANDPDAAVKALKSAPVAKEVKAKA